MRVLLDINVLIALLDGEHTLHDRARDWFAAGAGSAWASCPITQNGCVRIMSNPRYPNPLPVASVVERLTQATTTEHHEFWPDDVSLLDGDIVDARRVHGPRQITDLYLLALAVRRAGCFATFDGSIAASAVAGATAQSIVAL